MAQAYKLSTTEVVAPPGGRESEAIKAPSGELAESQRAEIIESVEVNLEKGVQDFKETTRLRNLEFQRKLDEVRARAVRLREKHKAELEHRDKAAEALKNSLDTLFRETITKYEARCNAEFDNIEANILPPIGDSLRRLDSSFVEFVTVTVPNVIEELQGTVTRKLQKQRETFDIENMKLQKRESKIISRFEVHQQNAAASAAEERDTRYEKFLSLAEEIDQTMRVDDRQTEASQVKVMKELRLVKQRLKEEAGVREKEDRAMLDDLSRSMTELQKSVLKNFGTGEAEDAAADDLLYE